MTKLTLPIQADKSYVRRDGVIIKVENVGPAYHPNGPLFAYYVNSRYFDGYANTGKSGLDFEYTTDLISDYEEPMQDYKHVYQALAEGKPVQFLTLDGVWQPHDEAVIVNLLSSQASAERFRVKPDTIKIGDVEVNAPMRVAPEVGTQYYSLRRLDEPACWRWEGDTYDCEGLAQGLCFRTLEDFEAAVKAILKLLKGQP